MQLRTDRPQLYKALVDFLSHDKVANVEFDGRDATRRDTWCLRLEPSELLRSQFSLDGLIPCVVSTDLQFSDSLFSSLERVSRNLGCDHDIGVIASGDPNATLKSRRRGANSLAVLVLGTSDLLTGQVARTGSLRYHLSRVLRTTDHFDQATPIQDEELFFGRADELETVEAVLRAGQHCGIFGLRKAGKTSFLNMVRLRLRKAAIPCQRLDLNRYAERSVNQVKAGIIHAVARALESVRVPLPPHLAPLLSKSYVPTPLEPWLNWLDRLLEHVPPAPSGSATNVILEVDESDHLIEAGPIQRLAARRDRHSVFVELRGYTQEQADAQRSGIVLVTAGVSRSLMDNAVMFEGDNQLFRLGRAHNLRPLDRSEVSELVRTLGKRSAARFRSHECIDLLHTELGGHPQLIRTCCSQVLQSRPADAPVPWEVPPAHIEGVLRRRGIDSVRAEASSYIDSFAFHFPEAAKHVLGLIDKPASHVRDAEVAELGRLYGLLTKDGHLRFRVLTR